MKQPKNASRSGEKSGEQLTPREQQILDCLSQGWLYKEIADRLDISVETARTHLKNIYRKLKVGTRTEAVVKHLRDRSGK